MATTPDLTARWEEGAVLSLWQHVIGGPARFPVKPQLRAARTPDGMPLARPICVPTMPDAMDEDHLFVLEDLIDDPIVAAPG